MKSTGIQKAVWRHSHYECVIKAKIYERIEHDDMQVEEYSMHAYLHSTAPVLLLTYVSVIGMRIHK